jgi:hypothetical protein
LLPPAREWYGATMCSFLQTKHLLPKTSWLHALPREETIRDSGFDVLLHEASEFFEKLNAFISL